MTKSISGSVVLTATERVIFGQPAAEAIAAEAKTIGASRVMLIASASLAKNTDEIARIEAALGDHHAATFTGIAPHVPRNDVIAATDMARDCGADLIVSVGGGSVTDLPLQRHPHCRSDGRLSHQRQ